MLVDTAVVLIFIFYVWVDYRRGFLRLSAELAGLVLAFILALKYYAALAEVLVVSVSFPPIAAKSIAFLIIWFMVQLVFYLAGRIVAFYTPTTIRRSAVNRYSGILPAAIKSVIFIAVLLLLLMVSPFNNNLKQAIDASVLGRVLTYTAVGTEEKLEILFSDTGQRLAFTINQNGEADKLNFTTTVLKIDAAAEERLLAKTNEERQKNNLSPLAVDPLIRNVARAHGRDMLLRGYFGHNSPDGRTLSDRLMAAKVTFSAAAENLALSPTVDLAHIGLMNSAKHRENILDGSFGRVGIGVLDAGANGLIVVEDFAN